MQALIGVCLIFWSFIDPIQNLFLVILIGLFISIFSSTQDISIDALRIEQIGIDEKNIMAAGASMAVIGWWTGFKLGGFISLILSDFFDKNGFENYWQMTFICLFLILIILNYFLLKINEKKSLKQEKSNSKKNFERSNLELPQKMTNILSWIFSTIIDPIYDFFKKNGVAISIGILSFIFLFKIGEAFLGRMSVIFYKEIGFSKSDIGIYSKALGWITTNFFYISRRYIYNKNRIN